jgi:hypothetical protein
VFMVEAVEIQHAALAELHSCCAPCSLPASADVLLASEWRAQYAWAPEWVLRSAGMLNDRNELLG